MKNRPSIDKSLLEKFFLNNCNPQERQQVKEWILDPANDFLLKAWMQEHWNLFTDYSQLEKPDVEKIWQNLQKDLLQQNLQEEPKIRSLQKDKTHLRRRVYKIAMMAAACLLLLMTGWYFIYIHQANTTNNTELTGSMMVKENKGAHTQDYLLEDGSIVTLNTNARLTYPTHFNAAKREVFLEGEAFFKVTKNTAQPFYVYCHHIVTHVVGTSFNVKEDKLHDKLEVAVHTGRVEVYEMDQDLQKKKNLAVLTPNQKVIYSGQSKLPETTLVENPLLLDNKYSSQDSVNHFYNSKGYFVFNSNSMLTIINALEKAYGVEITVSNESIYNCHFSGDLSEMSLYKKLDVINKALNTTYEVKDTKIIINGAGCN